MSNENNLFGANNGRMPRGFHPMSPEAQNVGFNTRYVPPHRRETTLDPIVRPESSMSNASFESQFPISGGGGVSLTDLMNGVSLRSRTTEGGQHGATVGHNMHESMRGFSDTQVGHSQSIGGLGSFQGLSAPGAGAPAQNLGGLGPVGALRYGASNTQQTSQFINSSNLADYGPIGSRSFAAARLPSVTHGDPSSSSNFRQPISTTSTQPVVGSHAPWAATNGISSSALTRQSSDSTAVDSVRGESTAKARYLAQMIKSGATDSPDDPAYGNPELGHSKKSRHPAAAPLPPPAHFNPSASKAIAKVVSAEATSGGGNTKGNAAAFFGVSVSALPTWFHNVQAGVTPTIENVFFSLPVMEPCRYAKHSSAGVIRIKDLPYTATRTEVTAFVGRNAHVLSQPSGSPFFAAHIIMDSSDGKTRDAFVEFDSKSEASWVIKQFEKRIQNKRPPKIGDRVVEVVISSQSELMHDLFPKAKNVTWEGNVPLVEAEPVKYYPNQTSTGFDGFLQKEQIYMIEKHADVPHRSAFVDRKIDRVYETWISILHKYPWFAHKFVFQTERRTIFEATLKLTKSLIHTLSRVDTKKLDLSKPTESTLQEFTVAVLTCPGFSEYQKAQVVKLLVDSGYQGMTTAKGMNLSFGGTHPASSAWPFQVLARAPSVPDAILQYFANLLREATVSNVQNMSLAELHTLRASGGDRYGPFGKVVIDYGNAKTLAEAGQIELRTIETLLRKVLPSTRSLGQPSFLSSF